MTQKYTVLISVYAKENPEYLKEAIDSMLKQTIQPDEIVLVEDGKLTKDLDEVIEQYKKVHGNLFKIIKMQENLGTGVALAIGIKECKNEYIAKMDSDDISEKYRCEKELEVLNNNENIDVVGSIVAEFAGDINNITGYRILPETNTEIYKFAQRRNPCAHSSVMMRKSSVLGAGNYRGCLYFEDYDLWIRMMQKGYKFYNIQEVLTYMRANESFYKRRGGLFYFKRMIQFRTEQYRNGFYTLKNYLLAITMHGVVCLLPNKIRKFIYLKFLRHKNEKI